MFRTMHGEFASLQEIRSAYLLSDYPQKFNIDPGPQPGRGPSHNLWASELGACPRKVAYRLLDTPEKPRSTYAAANKQVMFWAGDRFQYLTYSALNWAGLLVEHEVSVPMPEGWSGRLDALYKHDFEVSDTFLLEEKTVLPNALKYAYDMPKRKDCLQATGYFIRLGDCAGVDIEYVDRAGSNTPKLCSIDPQDWKLDVLTNMKVMENVRDSLPTLPEMIGQTFSASYTRNGDRMVIDKVNVVTDFRCLYCDYHLTKKEKRRNPHTNRMKEWGWTQPESTCKPINEPPRVVATFSNERISTVEPGFEDSVSEWLASTVTSYVPEEEE